MGHIRLGRLPRTQKWKEVVALVGGEGSAAAIANATMSGRVERERGGHGLRVNCVISERDNIVKSFIPQLRFSHPLIEPNVPY